MFLVIHIFQRSIDILVSLKCSNFERKRLAMSFVAEHRRIGGRRQIFVNLAKQALQGNPAHSAANQIAHTLDALK